MENAMQEVLFFATVLAPIILALTEVVKKVTDCSVKYIPLVAILFGLLVGYTSEPFTNLSLDLRLWSGVLSALSATGLFELYKTSKTGK